MIFTPRIGYISVQSNQDVHWGGLLVVDADGDPVEFTHTETMKLAPLMSTLLGQRLPGFVVTRLMSGPLLDCCTMKPDVVCFEEATVLHRRIDLNIPVAVFVPADFMADGKYWQRLDPQPDDGTHGGEWWGLASCCQQVQSVLQGASLHMISNNIVYPFERLGEALKQMHP
jgi:hypothetical protein